MIRCTNCGHHEPFVQLPVFLVTGPSGTGKSAVCRLLPGLLGDPYVVLEQDLVWLAGLRDPADDFAQFRRAWLNLVAAINQTGRPVVLCGTVVPQQLSACPELALVGDPLYLALVCDDDVLAARLRARPAWRDWDEPRIAEMLDFNTWVKTNAPTTDPPMHLLDTTTATVETTAAAVAEWITGSATD